MHLSVHVACPRNRKRRGSRSAATRHHYSYFSFALIMLKSPPYPRPGVLGREHTVYSVGSCVSFQGSSLTEANFVLGFLTGTKENHRSFCIKNIQYVGHFYSAQTCFVPVLLKPYPHGFSGPGPLSFAFFLLRRIPVSFRRVVLHSSNRIYGAMLNGLL